ncbi:MAG: hypothetical protein ACO3ZX_03625 [Candidatus Nanopelagicales bacterium]
MSADQELVLHIGTMKSGTTYLQHGLTSQLENLTAANWLYPMKFAPARGAINHERAIYGLVGDEIPWVDRKLQIKMQPQWQKLLDEIHDSSANVLLSAEALAVMLESGIEKLLTALPKRKIKVVLTARDLARVLPSSWQQSVRNGRPYGYDEYFDRIKNAAQLPVTEMVGSNFWRSYRLNEVVARWQKFIPLADISIITVPAKTSSDSLWARYIKAIGLPLDTNEPKFNDKQAHTSITWAEAEVLVELNQQWLTKGKSTLQRNQLRRRIVQEGFQQRSDRGAPIGLTAPWLELAREWSDDDIRKLLSLGVTIHGDIADLRVADTLTAALPCSSEEIEQARAVAARFNDRLKLQAIAKLFGISGKRA